MSQPTQPTPSHNLVVRNTFIDAIPETVVGDDDNEDLLRSQSDPTGGRSKYVQHLQRMDSIHKPIAQIIEGTRAQEAGEEDVPDLSPNAEDDAPIHVPPRAPAAEDSDDEPLTRSKNIGYPGQNLEHSGQVNRGSGLAGLFDLPPAGASDTIAAGKSSPRAGRTVHDILAMTDGLDLTSPAGASSPSGGRTVVLSSLVPETPSGTPHGMSPYGAWPTYDPAAAAAAAGYDPAAAAAAAGYPPWAPYHHMAGMPWDWAGGGMFPGYNQAFPTEAFDPSLEAAAQGGCEEFGFDIDEDGEETGHQASASSSRPAPEAVTLDMDAALSAYPLGQTPPLGTGPPVGGLHQFHPETSAMGNVSPDFRQFTKIGYEGRLSVVSESRVHTDGTHRYLVQFTAGELSRADGVGFVFSPRLPCAKNIQRIVSIFVNQRGRICMRVFADIVRASQYVKSIELGDWVEMAINLDAKIATFNIWPRSPNGWPAMSGQPASTAEFPFGNRLGKLNQAQQKQVKLNVGHLACVVKNVGVMVTLAS